jgi:predicted RNA methylase
VDRYVDFSANSKIYDHRHGGVIADQLVQAVANRLPQDATIIDIGAGTGRVSVALASNGFRAVAVDRGIQAGGRTALGRSSEPGRLGRVGDAVRSQ